jgi:nitroreductase
MDDTGESGAGTIERADPLPASLPAAHELGHDQLRRIIELARWAPSTHNTQPWWWQTRGTTLELWADRSRNLPASDPLGRNLVISCGAALHHTVVAAEAIGARTAVEYLPEGADSLLMARIDLTPGHPTPDALARLTLLRQRHTDRRRFTSWPVPAENLENLAKAGRKGGAAVFPVTDPPQRVEIEELLEQARHRQQGDPRVAEETETWIDHGPVDGVPSAVLPMPEGVRGERPTRFDAGLARERTDSVIRGTDGLLVISTPDDGPLWWLRAGMSLSALWLHATGHGLSVVPLSQVIEVQRTRAGLQDLLSPPDRVPQLLARVGWQEIGRDQLPRTPRRPVDELLRAGPDQRD